MSRKSLSFSLNLLLMFVVLTLLSGLAAAQQTDAIPAWKNPDLPAEQRAADLVAHMTLEEKVQQMQDQAPAIPRLGVPAYGWWNEALHGVARAGLATVFPQAIGLAATWDAPLMHSIADTISTEARAKYNDAIRHNNHGRYFGLTFWSPNINIFRDPRWGRGQETYGEDPYLTGQMAVAFIRGMQGDDPHYLKTVATAKHFAVHSGPEPLRHGFNVDPSRIDLNDTYLPAFRAAIEQGKADSVMCSYNAVDGDPSCANTFLLQTTLRGAWKFKGYVVSDCGAIGDILDGHHYRKTMAAAAAAAVNAGTDLSCGHEYSALVQAVHQGIIPESEIDRAVTRLFTARFRLGMFDPPARVPFNSIPYSEVDSPAHRQQALEAARESIVLLKNADHVLPLKANVRRIAVVGPSADDPDMLLGNYNGMPSHLSTPLAGLRQEFKGKANIQFALGSSYTAQSSALISEDVLFTQSGSKLTPGLRAEYFDNAIFAGKPVVTRMESRPYLRWEMTGPALAKYLTRPTLSVRWTGILRVAHTGDYDLGPERLACGECLGKDSARLYLDHRLIAEDAGTTLWQNHVERAKVHLVAGHDYHLRLEYSREGRSAGVELQWQPPAALLLREAVDAARNADVVIACVGLNSGLEGEEMKVDLPGFHGGDRTTLDLPAPQKALLQALLATGKPVVVVLQSGSAVALHEAASRAAAVLEAWYSGEEGGLAIAQTLDGVNNPAGRLPVTFYASDAQLPPFVDYSMRGRTYRYFRGKPLYPFGYGLSYSTFQYSNAKAVPSSDGGYQVTAQVKNTSDRAGDEVVQLYLHREGDADAAQQELRGFERIHLNAGEQRQVTFTLAPDVVHPAGQPAHPLRISIGGGQPLTGWPGVNFVQVSVQPQSTAAGAAR